MINFLYAPRAQREEKQKEIGKGLAHRQRSPHPGLTTLITFLVWLALSIWPFPLIPSPLDFPFLAAMFTFAYYLFWRGQGMLTVILLLIIPFLMSFSTSQDAFQVVREFTDDIKEKINFKNPLDFAKEQIYTSVGEWKNPKSLEITSKKGIEFVSITQDFSYDLPETALVEARLKVDGFKNPQTDQYEKATLELSCYEKHKITGQRLAQGKIIINDYETNLLTVPPAASSNHLITCFFGSIPLNQSLTPSSNGTAFEETDIGYLFFGNQSLEGTEYEDRIIAKKPIVIEAKLKRAQTSSTKLWTVQAQQLQRFTPEQLFKTQNDPDFVLRDGNYFVQPRCLSGCGGPYGLSITTGSQPITETKTPRLNVELIKQKDHFGLLTHLHHLSLAIPDSVTLQSGGSSSIPFPCDFTGITLKTERRNKMNQRLQEATDKARTSGKDQKTSIKFSCPYTVTNPSQTVGFTTLQVRAVYDVVVQGTLLAEVYKYKDNRDV